jgi:hypothetical protein
MALKSQYQRTNRLIILCRVLGKMGQQTADYLGEWLSVEIQASALET